MGGACKRAATRPGGCVTGLLFLLPLGSRPPGATGGVRIRRVVLPAGGPVARPLRPPTLLATPTLEARPIPRLAPHARAIGGGRVPVALRRADGGPPNQRPPG